MATTTLILEMNEDEGYCIQLDKYITDCYLDYYRYERRNERMFHIYTYSTYYSESVIPDNQNVYDFLMKAIDKTTARNNRFRSSISEESLQLKKRNWKRSYNESQ